jgi:hypothetical protein
VETAALGAPAQIVGVQAEAVKTVMVELVLTAEIQEVALNFI